jgi:hypothetical protein
MFLIRTVFYNTILSHYVLEGYSDGNLPLTIKRFQALLETFYLLYSK